MSEEVIEQNTAQNLNSTSNLLAQVFFNKVSEMTDLDGVYVVLMMMLYSEEGLSFEEILEEEITDADNIVEFLEPLKTMGLVSENQEELVLTEAGEELAAQLVSLADQVNDEAFKDFTQDEIDALNTFLDKVQFNCVSMEM